MFSIQKNLLPDEQILFQTKKHYIIFLVPVILTVAIFFFLFNSNELIVRLSFLPAIAAGLTWINQFLLYVSSVFAITNRRIIMREGFFYKHTNETRLATIANVSVNQSLLGQILNYGTVVIHAFGGDADPFSEIANPNEFQKQLQLQLDKIVK